MLSSSCESIEVVTRVRSNDTHIILLWVLWVRMTLHSNTLSRNITHRYLSRLESTPPHDSHVLLTRLARTLFNKTHDATSATSFYEHNPHTTIYLDFDRRIVMLSSSCDLKHWFQQKTRHAIIIVWFRQTHRHAIIMPSSSCDFDRHIMLSSSKIHLVISTYTSCHHHLVISTDTSSCYETIVWVRQRHRHAITNKMSTKARPFTRLARTPLSHDSHAHPFHTTRTHHLYGNIVMLSSSCDLSDRHMLWILSLPKEDFGRMNKRGNLDFRSTFQGREYSVWDTNQWKVSRKVGFHHLFILPKSSFGEHKFDRHIAMLSSCYHHLVSSTETSPCYHECNARPFHTTRTHALSHDGCYHCYAMRFFYGKIVMLSSSCDFDMHIIL